MSPYASNERLRTLVDNELGVTSRRVHILQLDESSLFPGDDEAPASEGDGLTARSRHYVGTKALSMWPLPGGKAAWRETLDDILAFIAGNAPSVEEVVKWIVDRYDKVNSPKVARGYLVSVLRPLDLIAMEGNRVALTARGAEYLECPGDAALLKIMRATIAGCDEIIEELSMSPRSVAELLELLKDSLGVTWETDAQVRFRLDWLETLGQISSTSGIWQVARPIVQGGATSST